MKREQSNDHSEKGTNPDATAETSVASHEFKFVVPVICFSFELLVIATKDRRG